MNKLVTLFLFLFIFCQLFANNNRDITDGCDLPESETTSYLHLTSDGSVLYKSLYDISGFQFDVDGATVNSASGGDMEANGLIGNSLGSTVLAFSMAGGSIPAGCGTLVNLSLSGEATGLSNIIVSDAFGSQIYFEYYEGEVDPFEFAQSSQQAAYFFTNVRIDDQSVESDDWVGAFCGENCVGGRQWDTSMCGGGVCEVIAMGDDGNDYSEGYCSIGDAVTFKIYDSSDGIYHDATPSEDIPWSVNALNFIDCLIAGDGNCETELTDGCDLPDSDETGYLHLTSDGAVLYKSPEAIAGWQFNVEGSTVNSASGGDTQAAGLIINAMG
ncbi:uncharacterized protein METZ01_LOCUS254519, partial [marine metagenome]